MELKYFRLIKTIAEEGNLANSSERLFLTQSALSHQLKDLEERLGFKVFLRSRNKWELTHEGQELYKLANKLFSSINESFESIKRIKEGSKGSIKFSVECQSFRHCIPSFIQKMGFLYPQIEINLALESSRKTISQVLSNEIDMALVTYIPPSEELTCIKIFEDEIFALVHYENALSTFEYLEAGHFLDDRLLINAFPLESVWVYEYFLKLSNITPKNISAIPFTEASLSMVKANLGIMCVPKWQVKEFKNLEDIIFKRIGRYGLKRNHYLVMKTENRNKKYIHEFVTNFQEHFLE